MRDRLNHVNVVVRFSRPSESFIGIENGSFVCFLGYLAAGDHFRILYNGTSSGFKDTPIHQAGSILLLASIDGFFPGRCRHWLVRFGRHQHAGCQVVP